MSRIVELSPKQFECHVKKWLENSGLALQGFSVTRLEHIAGHGGRV
jgi:hypothetical protein